MRAHRMAIAAGLGVAILGLGFSSDVLAQQGRAGGAGARGTGAGARGGGAEGGGVHILERAQTEKAVPIPGATLAQYFKQMDAANEATLRMIEGGQFNVNIRRIKKPEAAPLIHPKTIDVWYVLEGSGSVTSGGTFANGKVTGGVTDRLTPATCCSCRPTCRTG